MAEPLPPLDSPEHSDAWTFAYLDGELSPGEKAQFEDHLKAHEACRVEVETMRAALPAFVKVLMEDGPPRTGAEYLAMARAAEAKVAARPPHAPKRAFWPWALGAGFATLAAAAAGLLVMLDPFSAGLEPELLARVQMAPMAGTPGKPLPPWPIKMEGQVAIVHGKLEVSATRLPTDVYTAVALIDAKSHQWVAQPGTQRCAPDCGPLKLRIELDRLPPGPFRVMVLLSDQPITDDGLRQWLPQADLVAPRWLGVRAYSIARVQRPL